MDKTAILREIFDQRILAIVNILIEEPQKYFSLTEIANSININVATTLRILKKLVDKEVVEKNTMGKSSFYRLKESEKTITLRRMLQKEEHLHVFLDRIKNIAQVKKVLLENRTENEAKLIIIGDVQEEKINSIVEEIKKRNNFSVKFVILSEKQFEKISSMEIFNLDKKILWQR